MLQLGMPACLPACLLASHMHTVYPPLLQCAQATCATCTKNGQQCTACRLGSYLDAKKKCQKVRALLLA